MKLKEAIIILPKSKIKAGDGKKEGKYPLYRSSNKLDTYYDEYLLDEEVIIIGTGGNPSIHYNKGKCAYTTQCLVLKSKGEFENKYIYYYLLSRLNKIKRMFRGLAIKQLDKKAFFKLDILLVDKVKQKKIIENLDKISNNIKSKKEQLKSLEQLVKSQFVEMFETIKRYVELQKVCLFINGDRGENYPSGDKISKNKDGIAFINAGLLERNKVNWSNMNYISEDTYNNLRSGKIQKDDILYCLRGSLGKCAIIDFSERGAIASSLVILRANKNEINPNFLLIQLGMEEILYQQNQANNGSSQPNLSANSVKKYKILLPPLSLQNEFSEIVKQIDKQKFEIEKSLKETQELYESLMQEYF